MKLADLATIKDLMKSRMALALQSEIPDPKAYAEQWHELGQKFTELDCPANAAICVSNWKRYGGVEVQQPEPEQKEEWWNR